ncbi:MAG: nucleoside transporter C-terminal domain-containing protein [Gammaproteobacteria bacterium]|nr:nucleoside transporter C-terminal domain-containing protein [Gammaproteobacteria bacterium]
MSSLQSALGLGAFVALAWALSENRRGASWRVALAGVSLQLLLGLLLLKVPPVAQAIASLNGAVLALQEATLAGSSFVFGYLAGPPLPFEETRPGASFVLAFRALPLIIVVSALTALLDYWRILPWIVRGFAALLRKSLGVGGAVGFATAANVFVGMVEAPLFIRSYLASLTRSELFVVMTAGMATIAGTVLVLYAHVLTPVIPDAVGHLLTASVMSAPAAIMVALLMFPESRRPGASDDAGDYDVVTPSSASGAMDAITRGALAGLQLFLNVIALLLVLVALVHLVDGLLALLPAVAGEPLTLARMLGVVMAPVCWLMGVPWSEAPTAGALMGTKTVLNELLAYLELAALSPGALDERSRIIMSYAMCGFANLGSLGILIGGLATLVPERREEVVALGGRSLVAGTLATCCTGAVVGIIL